MAHPLVVRLDEPYDIRVDRATEWGNPFPANRERSRGEAILMHRNWLLRSSEGRKLMRRLSELTGKRLGCHCAPKACHAETYARMANNPWTVRAYR